VLIAVLAPLLLTSGCGRREPSTVAKYENRWPPSGPTVSFSLPSDAGDLVTVPLPNAKATVLDFFGPSCEPCRVKLPRLFARRKEIDERGARLVLVAILADGENTLDAERALEKWGVAASFLVDDAGVSLREAGVDVLPSTIILDARSRLRWRGPVDATADDVLDALDSLVGRASFVRHPSSTDGLVGASDVPAFLRARNTARKTPHDRL
jgi:hypothetical protein